MRWIHVYGPRLQFFKAVGVKKTPPPLEEYLTPYLNAFVYLVLSKSLTLPGLESYLNIVGVEDKEQRRTYLYYIVPCFNVWDVAEQKRNK